MFPLVGATSLFAVSQRTTKSGQMAKASTVVCPFFAVCFSVTDGKELLCHPIADGKELADGKVADFSSGTTYSFTRDYTDPHAPLLRPVALQHAIHTAAPRPSPWLHQHEHYQCVTPSGRSATARGPPCHPEVFPRRCPNTRTAAASPLGP